MNRNMGHVMAQTSTHDSEADLLEALLRSDKALVAIKMPDTTLIALNDAAVALWGITADEAVGLSLIHI